VLLELQRQPLAHEKFVTHPNREPTGC